MNEGRGREFQVPAGLALLGGTVPASLDRSRRAGTISVPPPNHETPEGMLAKVGLRKSLGPGRPDRIARHVA